MQTLDIEAIKEVLPHRYPFLLVDRVVELEPGIRAVGLKNVTANEEFFQGHFPKRMIMPGVLLIECMAQVGGVMIQTLPAHREKLALLGSVDNAKFRKPVTPGDTISVEAKMVRTRGNFGWVHCEAKVGEALAAEADIMFALVES